MHFHGGFASGSPTAPDPLSSHRDVTYSCGSCGYALNLSSSNRNTAGIGSKYGRAIKKGVVSFFSIDESRFSRVDELACLPYFTSNSSWGLLRRRTRLTCRKCGSFIGSAYDLGSSPAGPDGSQNGAGVCRRYDIRISALQPSSDESGTPLVM